MCIIIHKKAGVAVPSEKILKTCSTSHKDGFGMAVRVGDKIIINKGCYTVESITKLVNRVPKEYEAVFHFRMATHGTVCHQNCHPFPLSTRNDALRTTVGVFETALVHNGIIHDFGEKVTRNNSLSLSDTMNFIKFLCVKTKGRFTYDNIKKYIPPGYGKFIVLIPGWTFWYGDFVEDGGLLYSNTTYKSYEYKNMNGNLYSKGNYKSYDYYEPSSWWFESGRDDKGPYFMHRGKAYRLKDSDAGCFVEVLGNFIPLHDCITVNDVADTIDDAIEAIQEDGVVYATP